MKPVVLIGAGGIGAPAALVLAAAGVGSLAIVDDDGVELSNLHRQILFEDDDVGADKLEALGRALSERYPALSVRLHHGRALPGSALDLVAGASVVVDATDNYASRFLLADAAHLAGVPIVHAASVRWQATVMAVAATGRPCYRCLFEDIPRGETIDCATAGVAGPVCGVAGAVAADRALRLLRHDVGGHDDVYGAIVTYDGLQDRLREVALARRADCSLCGDAPTIGSIDASRYTGALCEATEGLRA